LSLLSFVDRFSYKQILAVGILLAVLFAIPTTVLLVRQQTRLYSSAHKANLPANYEVVVEPFGQPSANPPKIKQIKPFLGKVDDVVFIYGRDFGQNPQDRSIYFGGVKVHEEDILKWHNEVIEVMVPLGAESGPVRVMVAGRENTYGLPFTVYDMTTKRKVFWQGNDLMVEEGFNAARVLAVMANGEQREGSVSINQPVGLLLAGLPSRDLAALVLYDAAGRLLPFFVNPPDFGF